MMAVQAMYDGSICCLKSIKKSPALLASLLPVVLRYLDCQLHQTLIAHGEHLTSRCQGWTDGRLHGCGDRRSAQTGAGVQAQRQSQEIACESHALSRQFWREN